MWLFVSYVLGHWYTDSVTSSTASTASTKFVQEGEFGESNVERVVKPTVYTIA